MKRTTIYLTTDQRQSLFKVAKEKNITFSEVIRRAINNYVNTPIEVMVKSGQYVTEIPVRFLRHLPNPVIQIEEESID